MLDTFFMTNELGNKVVIRAFLSWLNICHFIM